jgi:hypothetical protein
MWRPDSWDVRRGGRPVLEDRRDHLPGRLYLVGAHEPRAVVAKYIEEQDLVGLG